MIIDVELRAAEEEPALLLFAAVDSIAVEGVVLMTPTLDGDTVTPVTTPPAGDGSFATASDTKLLVKADVEEESWAQTPRGGCMPRGSLCS